MNAKQLFFSHNWFCKGAKWQEKKPIVFKYSGCFAAYFGSGPVYIKVVGPQVGEVTRGGLPHLTRKHDHIKMRDYMGRRVTSPTWGPPPPCKQAFRHVFILFVLFRLIFFLFPIQLFWTSHTHVQLTFTKDDLQQNENYNLKLTKKKPDTIKILVVTKIKWEHNQLSKQNFIP